jgi:predicted enzyme related to lactoylglutathione lyase
LQAASNERKQVDGSFDGKSIEERNLMAIRNVLASVAVKDLSAAIGWYERLFGRSADSRPMPEVAEWKFDRGGWLQIYQLPERAGSGSFTLVVEGLENEIAWVEKLGIDTRQRTSDDKVKTLMITDPDGNHIAFAEVVGSSMAR